MSTKNLAVAAFVSALSLVSTAANANSYSFDYVALSSYQFSAVSGDFGSNVNIGDTVTLNLAASAGNHFQAVASDNMWAILGFQSGANRISDYSWSFYNNNVIVGSGSSFGEGTCCIHMGPYVSNIGFSGDFDKYSWTGTLLSSDSGNDNVAGDIGYNSPPLPGYGGQWWYGSTSASFVTTPVPEPETYAMMLAGLGLLGVVARRRKQKDSTA